MTEVRPYSLRKYQKFAQRFMTPDKSPDKLFLFHGTGAGKTCSAVLIAENHRRYYGNNPQLAGKIFIIGSFIVHENFIRELIGFCGKIAGGILPDEPKNAAIPAEDLAYLDGLRQNVRKMSRTDPAYILYRREYKKLIMNPLRNMGYRFYSYQKMINETGSFPNSLFIIDEAHNLLNNNEYNLAFQRIFSNSPRSKAVFMTATPMYNHPDDIREFAGILTGKRMPAILDKNAENLLPGAEKILRHYFGKITSYVRGNDPHFFPERREIGRKIPGLRFTKIISVPMSALQYKAYKAEWKGVMTMDIRNIMNCVFPGPIYSSIESVAESGKIAGLTWGKRFGFRGKSLALRNIRRFSGKYYKICRDILASRRKNFVYHSYVNNTGIKFLAAILLANGMKSYSISRPATANSLFVITQETPYELRRHVMRVYNSPENRNGEHIRVLLGSVLTRESLDLKDTSEVRIATYQENMSRLEQIIGRAIRAGSMDRFPKNERIVNIYKYVSGLPAGIRGLSAEEQEYVKDEKNHIVIKKIERILKKIAIDCRQNREFNLFPALMSRENNTVLCDYMKCSYQCSPSGNNDPANEYYQYDFMKYDAKEVIFRHMRQMVVFDEEFLREIADSEDLPHDIVYDTVREMIISGESFTNSRGNAGKFVKLGRNFFFQPDEIPDYSVDLNVRLNPPTIMQNRINVTGLMREISKEFRQKVRISPVSFYKKMHKLYNRLHDYGKFAVTLREIMNLRRQEQVAILEDAILKYRRAHATNGKLDPIHYNILKIYRRFLLDEKQANAGLATASPDKYFASHSFSGIDRGKNFVGHYLGDLPVIIMGRVEKFKEVSVNYAKSRLFSRKSSRNLPENDFIVGISEKNDRGNIVFKLKYTRQPIVTDARFKTRGFVCAQTNDKEELKDIAAKLGVSVKGKETIRNLCHRIEYELRSRQIRENKKKSGAIRWFYDAL